MDMISLKQLKWNIDLEFATTKNQLDFSLWKRYTCYFTRMGTEDRSGRIGKKTKTNLNLEN